MAMWSDLLLNKYCIFGWVEVILKTHEDNINRHSTVNYLTLEDHLNTYNCFNHPILSIHQDPLRSYDFFGVSESTLSYKYTNNIFQAFYKENDSQELLNDQSFANMLAMHQLAFIENWPDKVKDSFYQGVESYDEDYDPTDAFENELLSEQKVLITYNMIDRWINEFVTA